MRICKAVSGIVFLAALSVAAPALAFDIGALQSETPDEAFRHGFDLYQQGDKTTAVEALEFAAQAGHPIAQWKLGRMYAEGDGIEQDDLKAFQMFSAIANAHADDSPSDPNSPFVANAFVALGAYYRDGIPNTPVTPNGSRARQIFNYAASYFGDAEAQLNLARMWYDGTGGQRDPRQAAGWAKLAADKGNVAAQALLGRLLFEGEGITRQPIVGLMFLSIARARAGGSDLWIWRMHEEAFSLATEAERRTATAMAEDWLARNASLN